MSTPMMYRLGDSLITRRLYESCHDINAGFFSHLNLRRQRTVSGFVPVCARYSVALSSPVVGGRPRTPSASEGNNIQEGPKLNRWSRYPVAFTCSRTTPRNTPFQIWSLSVPLFVYLFGDPLSLFLSFMVGRRRIFCPDHLRKLTPFGIVHAQASSYVYHPGHSSDPFLGFGLKAMATGWTTVRIKSSAWGMFPASSVSTIGFSTLPCSTNSV